MDKNHKLCYDYKKAITVVAAFLSINGVDATESNVLSVNPVGYFFIGGMSIKKLAQSFSWFEKWVLGKQPLSRLLKESGYSQSTHHFCIVAFIQIF